MKLPEAFTKQVSLMQEALKNPDPDDAPVEGGGAEHGEEPEADLASIPNPFDDEIGADLEEGLPPYMKKEGAKKKETGDRVRQWAKPPPTEEETE